MPITTHLSKNHHSSITFDSSSRKTDLIFFVVPKLLRSCDMGHDSLEFLRILIDPEGRRIIFKDNREILSYKVKKLSGKTCKEHRVELFNCVNGDISEEFNIFNMKE